MQPEHRGKLFVQQPVPLFSFRQDFVKSGLFLIILDAVNASCAHLATCCVALDGTRNCGCAHVSKFLRDCCGL